MPGANHEQRPKSSNGLVFFVLILYKFLTIDDNLAIGIPSFVSFYEHRKHIVVHMAAVFRNWARCGFTEGISGHISVRDPEFEHLIWMNPIGKHFGLLNGSDMLCLRISDGEIVGGNRVSKNRYLSDLPLTC